MIARALDVLLPRSCAGCSKGPWPFCPSCAAALEPLTRPWCERCGHPWDRSVAVCAECLPPPVRSARAAFRYEGPARRAVHRLKFSGWRDVSAAMAEAMLTLDLPEVDAITWVPLARGRLAERGYDQARALAVSVGRRSGLPARRLLRRTVATTPQARRGAAERRAALAGAFVAVRAAPARVLLIDDVITTGSTAAAGAMTLAAAGASEIHVVAACRSFDALRDPRTRAYPAMGSRPGLWLPGDVPR